MVPLGRSFFLPQAEGELKGALAGCEVIINLAGATINQRWTEVAKRKILLSRTGVTRQLVAAVNGMLVKPSLFISASAVGIYPGQGLFTESNASVGTGFLAEVCTRWEDEAQKLSPDVRLVIARLGVVLGRGGGALRMIALPFRLFVGGKIASGQQGFSWIHLEDVMRAMQFLIVHPELSGVVNFVAPEPVVNRLLANEIGMVLHRPVWLTVPPVVFRMLYGEGEVLLTEGQQAYPGRLLSAGYVFRYADIRHALCNLLL